MKLNIQSLSFSSRDCAKSIPYHDIHVLHSLTWLRSCGPEQQVASGCRVDLLNNCEDCGTSSAGFFVKNPSGLSITLTRSMGITGKSSIRGLWVRPNARVKCQQTSTCEGLRKSLTVPEDDILIFYAIIPACPYLHTLGTLTLIRELASRVQFIILILGHPDGSSCKLCTLHAVGLGICQEHLARH